MRLIAVKPVGIGLHNFTGLKEQQSDFVPGHTGDKSFRIIERVFRGRFFKQALIL